MDALTRKQVMERLEKATDHLDDLSGELADPSTYGKTMIIEACLFDARRMLEESARPGGVADSPFVPCENRR
jgi:hypothetical protein